MKNKVVLILLLSLSSVYAQSPVGKWKKITHVSTFNGQTFDSHKALLVQRPCVAKFVYEINADATFRLNALQSGCDEKYTKVQEKLYSETKWKVEGNKITISS
ncbi:MAG TPA: hypothetical protein PK035_05440, partial [Chitinophagales bacterium]|nr:hypothetical protein [Chitinophagales bacterium]